MKKLLYIFILFISLVSCKDFLEEESQDLTAVEHVDHYSALLLTEFNKNYAIFSSVYYMSDELSEIELAPLSTKTALGRKPVFTWQQEIELDEEENTLNNNTAWNNIYEDIAITNYVITSVSDMDGHEDEKMYVKGEAHFIRAISYFNLLNLYGQPYNPSSKDTDLGVPLKTNTEVQLYFKRNSVAEGYALVEQDLMAATQLIEESGVEKSLWHPSVTACNLLMSRVKLYQHKWREAVDYANMVIQEKQLSTLNTSGAIITAANTELIYSWHKQYPGQLNIPSTDQVGYKVSEELLNLYEAGDNRKDSYFNAFTQDGNTYYMTRKNQASSDGSSSSSTYTTHGYQNLRVAEAYLNKAEALAHLQDAAAIDVVKSLHASRFSDVSTVVYPTAPDEVLTYVMDERFRELCFEDHHRWFDLRRMNNRPEIVHKFTSVDNDGYVFRTETFTLLSDDLNYTLPIPIKERENNPDIVNNERIDKLPVLD